MTLTYAAPAAEGERSVMSIVRLCASYFGRHWRGEFRLAISCWVSGALGLVVFIIIGGIVNTLLGGEYQPARGVISLAGMWFSMVVIVLWHSVGVWRSASRHRSRGGRRISTITAKTVAALLFTTVAASLASRGVPELHEAFRIAQGDPSVGPFEIRVLAGGREVEFSGGIPQGATAALQQVLDTAPRVHTIHLNSHGGRLGEAARMRDLIRQHGFDTYTATGCFSACTIAFLGGRQRFVNPTARLGFHASSFPGSTKQRAQRDNEAIRQEIVRFGVDAEFAARAVGTPHEEMWTPSVTDLVRAGYASAPSEGQFAISGFGADPSRAAIANAIRQISLFDAVAEAQPETFEILVEMYSAGIADGSPEGIVHGRMREPLGLVIAQHLARASDEAVLAFGAVIVEQITFVEKIGGDECFDLLFPDPAAPNRGLRHLDVEMTRRDTAASEAVIRTGMKNPRIEVDADEYDGLIETVTGMIAEAHGEAAVEKLPLLGTPALSKIETCRHTMAFYGAILRLPPSDGAKVIRHLLSQD